MEVRKAGRDRQLPSLMQARELLADFGRIRFEAFGCHARLERVWHYVCGDLGRPVTRSEVARVAGLEENYFSAFFHTRVGVCFRDWLAMMRIARALHLCRMRNRSLQRIARDVGYRNVDTFRRSFKRHTGTTPHAFRRKNVK